MRYRGTGGHDVKDCVVVGEGMAWPSLLYSLCLATTIGYPPALATPRDETKHTEYIDNDVYYSPLRLENQSRQRLAV